MRTQPSPDLGDPAVRRAMIEQATRRGQRTQGVLLIVLYGLLLVGSCYAIIYALS